MRQADDAARERTAQIKIAGEHAPALVNHLSQILHVLVLIRTALEWRDVPPSVRSRFASTCGVINSLVAVALSDRASITPKPYQAQTIVRAIDALRWATDAVSAYPEILEAFPRQVAVLVKCSHDCDRILASPKDGLQPQQKETKQ